MVTVCLSTPTGGGVIEGAVTLKKSAATTIANCSAENPSIVICKSKYGEIVTEELQVSSENIAYVCEFIETGKVQ